MQIELVPSENCEGESVPFLSFSFRWFVGTLQYSPVHKVVLPRLLP